MSAASAARPLAGPNISYVEWGPIAAGAFVAAAIFSVMMTFGGAIGLTLASPWPNAGASISAVAIVVSLWTLFAHLLSFAAGGYLAGRLRHPFGGEDAREGQFRDGAHGFTVWAVGVIFSLIVGALVSGLAVGTVAQSLATIGSGAASGLAARGDSRAGPADFAVDLLLRPGAAAPSGGADVTPEARAALSRVFTSAISNQALTVRDRDYLAQVVTRQTGLAQPEAQKRVEEAINEARDLEIKARAAADKARRTAFIAAFLAAAAMLASCAAACAGASLGGRHRDERTYPLFFGHRFW